MKILICIVCTMGLSALTFAQDKKPLHINPIDAKSHIGQEVTVCGKVVDTKVPKYGIAGHGKPVSFDLDQPAPNPVFFFVAFGEQPAGPKEVVDAYNGKRVCVTGKVEAQAGGVPFILATDRSQIKPEPEAEKN
jgi:hypothetical protein